MYFATQNCVGEWQMTSDRPYDDPFGQVTLDVIVTGPDGQERCVPAFWSGDDVWRIRYASPTPGVHRWRSRCSDESNSGLHDREGTIEVRPYEGEHRLRRHGPLRMSANRRHLEHIDGTPFFWLADTWWMGLCQRLVWPEEFHTLTADRVGKGFSVVQIVAGLYPDMPAFDPRGANEAGYPWEPDFERISPAYFDMADLRIAHLVHQGLVPCIVGCWGYYLCWTGVEKMKQHWRYLIARWGAYPVVWCLAGEGAMPFYLSEDREKDVADQKQGWTDLAQYVRDTDPYGHPVTIHPTDTSRSQMLDPSLLDLDMLQTGHGDRDSIPNTVRSVREARGADPTLPFLNSEVCYEGIGEASRQEVQRFMFWTCLLSGACGHTYGANGIWQLNRPGAPYGPSPHGMSWGDTPWDDAMQLPGSAQVGLGAGLLQRHAWWEFEPHQEWVSPSADDSNYSACYAAGIPGRVRVIFIPRTAWGFKVCGLEADVRYRAFLFNPTNGTEMDLGQVTPDDSREWRPGVGRPPYYQDLVLVLEAIDA